MSSPVIQLTISGRHLKAVREICGAVHPKSLRSIIVKTFDDRVVSVEPMITVPQSFIREMAHHDREREKKLKKVRA